MRVGTAKHNGSIGTFAGAGGRFADLSGLDPRLAGVGGVAHLAADPALHDAVRAHLAGVCPEGHPGEGMTDGADLTWLAPLPAPGKIVAVGLNYADHTAEAGLVAPLAPLLFAKFPTSVVGPGVGVPLDPMLSEQVDFEVELAVIIGAECGPRRPGNLANVFGYTIGNDVSARDLQQREGQWVRAKSLDGFCPLGPWVVTADEIPDPQALRIGLDVNGEAQQDATTGDMFFSVDKLLAFITAGITLLPGDVVLTGTPPGCGAFQHPPRFLRPGDTMSAWIEGIGRLTNPLVASAAVAG